MKGGIRFGVLAWGAAVLVALLIAGCAETPRTESSTPQFSRKQFAQWQRQLVDSMCAGPCGCIVAQRPFVNITGKFTIPPWPNATVLLYAAPNASFDAAMYVVRNCHPIRRLQLEREDHFALGLVPAGQYLVAVRANSFAPGALGFPVIDETANGNLTVKLQFVGSDMDYAVAAFVVRLANLTGEDSNPSPETSNHGFR